MQLLLDLTLSCLILYCFSGFDSAFGAEVVYDLNAYYLDAKFTPDGVKKQVLGVNGQFPGPTIRARIGDTLVVRVTNSIRHPDGTPLPTSVHWHGIEMHCTPWYDGPEGVTQCPIPYGESMVYRFKLLQSGTYWYHSHHSWQYVDGFWGLLIIDNAPEVYGSFYTNELSISLTDWHHTPASILSEVYHNKPDHTTPRPNSGLIGGHGSYNCASAGPGVTCDPSKQCPSVYTVIPGATYRIRVINAAARVTFTFGIDGHKLTAIEVDGVDTIRVGPIDTVDIWPAQRYSFLVTMNGHLDNYWIRAQMSSMENATEVPMAILHYDRNSCPGSSSNQQLRVTPQAQGQQGRPEIIDIDWTAMLSAGPSVSNKFPFCEEPVNYMFTTPPPINEGGANAVAQTEKDCMAAASIPRPTTQQIASPLKLNPNFCRPYANGVLPASAPTYVHQQVTLAATFETGPDYIKGLINGRAYRVFSPPVIFKMIQNTDITPNSNPQYLDTLNRTVQVIINNQNNGPHPWHLHGHTFWVVGSGPGNYSGQILNPNGVRRDTVETPAQSWVALRFVSDNPGAWLFHCHINWHLEIGLGAVFVEGRRELRSLYTLPDEAKRVCALNGTYL